MEEPTRISPSLFWKCSHSQEELHSPRGRPPFEEGGSDGLGGKYFHFHFPMWIGAKSKCKEQTWGFTASGISFRSRCGFARDLFVSQTRGPSVIADIIRPGPQDDQNWVFAKLRLLWSAHSGYSVRPGAPPWGGWEGQACLESRRVQLGHSKQRFSQRIFSGESALGEGKEFEAKLKVDFWPKTG